MKIYYSGIFNSKQLYYPSWFPKIGMLYAFKNKKTELRIPEKCNSLFIDSGAYEAWTRKKEINIDLYIEWIKENNFNIYTALDVIGNEHKSIENYMYMLDNGLHPIPVYHCKDDIKTLHKYMDTAKYIGISPLASYSKKENDLFMYHAFDALKGTDIKTHGFGVMAIDTITKFPFYSIDGTYPFRLARFGSVKTKKGNSKMGIENIKHKEEILGVCEKYNLSYDTLNSYESDGFNERFLFNVLFFENLDFNQKDKRRFFK